VAVEAVAVVVVGVEVVVKEVNNYFKIHRLGTIQAILV
jgi:hypothetical protein